MEGRKAKMKKLVVTSDQQERIDRMMKYYLSRSDNLSFVTRIDQFTDTLFVISFSNGGITPVKISKTGKLDTFAYNTVYLKGEN